MCTDSVLTSVKAGFHWQRSWNQSRKSSSDPVKIGVVSGAISSTESKSEESERFHVLLIPRMTPTLLILWKLNCRSRKSRHRDWLGFPLLLLTLTIQFSLDRKRRSHNRKRKKWKCSDSSDSDSVELMTPLTTPIFDFHKLSHKFFLRILIVLYLFSDL